MKTCEVDEIQLYGFLTLARGFGTYLGWSPRRV
jgi:hypothetical protein